MANKLEKVAVVRLVQNDNDHRLKKVIATWKHLDQADQLILYGIVKAFAGSTQAS